ncbi:MAG: tRNA lysidine(34) synthetase TilS [Clostridia bacterium]
MINLELIENYDKIVCGVSGGADSIALVHSLKQLEKTQNIQVFACHLNHKTRGEESVRDLNFTIDFCKAHSIPIYFEEIDIPVDKKLGFEATARKIRYDFFERALNHFRANKIATAHNCDDNLETILLNISRGTGLKGLCGIPHTRNNIIRPILHKTRCEIEDYLKLNSIDFIIDSSNNTDDYSRNKIRHHVLPILNEINTKATQNSYIMSNIVFEDDSFLNEISLEEYKKIVYNDLNCYKINIADVLKLHKSICYRVLNLIFKKLNSNLTYTNFYKILEMCEKKNPSFSLDFNKYIEIFREYDTIVFRENLEIVEKTTFQVLDSEIFIDTNMFENLHKSYKVDFKKIDLNTLEIGSKQIGDTICLSGGTKTLKKLFIDKKIPQKLRAFVPVLRDKHGIICVCFIGVDLRRMSKNNKENIIFRSKNNEK